MNLCRHRCSTIVQTRSDLEYSERLSFEPFLEICKSNQVSRSQSKSLHTGIKIDVGISSNGPVQLEFCNPCRLIEIWNPEGADSRRDFLPYSRHIVHVHQFKAVLLVT